jgi:dihydrolipoamide dehydrogenase|tara:strand:+ start:6024 stop:7439 length:1416 start_codon:yes stop_codon:yes gene_type:complete
VTESTTDLAVVGAGPGGCAAAFLAADLGIGVTLIDEAPNPGGTCLYRGCIPSKSLLHVANVIDEAERAEVLGVKFGAPALDLRVLREWKSRVIEQLGNGLGQLSSQRQVKYIQGRASILDPHRLSIRGPNGDQAIRFEHVILATGSSPVIPTEFLFDSDRVMDSTGALELSDVPPRLLIVGGGYIGLELATVYAAFGSRITIVEMTDDLLPGADRDLVIPVKKRMAGLAEAIWLGTTVARMESADEGVKVTLEGEAAGNSDQVFDRVLVSVGRRPNSKIEGLDKTQVQLDTRGFVQVDGQRRTAEPSIFAIGDLVGEPMLAHKASHEGRLAVEVIRGSESLFEPLAIPAVVFTDPEIAWCGLTETQAKTESRAVKVAKFPWGASGRAVTLDRIDGMTKLIVECESEKVIGVGMVGAGAGELIAEGVLAIQMGATASDMKTTIHPHPTLSETVMESAEVFFAQSTHYRGKAR